MSLRAPETGRVDCAGSKAEQGIITLSRVLAPVEARASVPGGRVDGLRPVRSKRKASEGERDEKETEPQRRRGQLIFLSVELSYFCNFC